MYNAPADAEKRSLEGRNPPPPSPESFSVAPVTKVAPHIIMMSIENNIDKCAWTLVPRFLRHSVFTYFNTFIYDACGTVSNVC